jgi:hypothetical protein
VTTTTLRTGAAAGVASGKVAATGWPGQETSGIRAARMRSAASAHCAATVTDKPHLE